MPKTSSIRPSVSVEHRLVTDAEGQTQGRSIYRASIASRGNKRIPCDVNGVISELCEHCRGAGTLTTYRKYLERVLGGDLLAFPRRLFNDTSSILMGERAVHRLAAMSRETAPSTPRRRPNFRDGNWDRDQTAETETVETEISGVRIPKF